MPNHIFFNSDHEEEKFNILSYSKKLDGDAPNIP